MVVFTVSEQMLLFLKACLLGVCLGVLYDVFRILRIAVRTPAVLIFFEDLLFFGIAAGLTFAFFMAFVGGQVRFFVLAGETLGFAVYYFTVGALVFRAAAKIIEAIKKTLRLLYRVFARPVIRLFCFFYNKLTRFISAAFMGIKKICEKQKILLQRKRILLYNQKGRENKVKDSCKDGESKKKQKKQKSYP